MKQLTPLCQRVMHLNDKSVRGKYKIESIVMNEQTRWDIMEMGILNDLIPMTILNSDFNFCGHNITIDNDLPTGRIDAITKELDQ